MSNILNWDGNIATGLVLLKEHQIVSDAYINIYKQLPDAQAKQKIAFALEKYTTPKSKKSNSINIELPSKAEKIVMQSVAPNKEDNEIAQQAKRKADKLYKEMQNYRAELLSLTSALESPLENDEGIKNKRATLAAQIAELEPLVNNAYSDYRYAQENGTLPIVTEPQAEAINPITLHQQITNLRKSLNRDKNLKNQTIRVIQRIKEKEERLEILTKEYESISQP